MYEIHAKGERSNCNQEPYQAVVTYWSSLNHTKHKHCKNKRYSIVIQIMRRQLQLKCRLTFYTMCQTIHVIKSHYSNNYNRAHAQ